MGDSAIADYQSFLESKRLIVKPAGFDVAADSLNAQLFPFQREIVRWALSRGRAAVFADCGLGKTPMQLEWAQQIVRVTGRDVLILTPLAVGSQTVREGEKFGIAVRAMRRQEDVQPGISITNYEMLVHFDPDEFGGIVLDESSILKGFGGALRKQITEFAEGITFRLACTATPAPNDLIELTNHAEFLDVMSGKEIIALFFTQDGNTTHKWRLKGHAREDFWRWMASWSVALRRPSDLGYSDDGFILPALRMHQETVQAHPQAGQLFAMEALTLGEQRASARASLAERVAAAAELANNSNEPWLIWCNLNAESQALFAAIPDAVGVEGSDPPEFKEQALLDFTNGHYRVLISKPSIAGHGMNWQHCRNVAFVGLSHSYEQFYQAIRRCWRFGQEREVNCYVITSEADGPVVRNIERKEKQAAEMMDQIVGHMRGLQLGQQEREEMDYEEDIAEGKDWKLSLGDAVERIDALEPESIGLSIFSPPFPLMYAYTNSAHDMGNVGGTREMLAQFRYLASMEKLGRVLMPGRLVCIHISQPVTLKSREGYIGLADFRGPLIELMQSEGWIFHGEVTIDKDPQVKAARTKELALLFKTLANDSTMCRPALADYVLLFRKPGENPIPVRSGDVARYNPDGGWISEREWIEWARPVWTDIRETDVLNVAQARETDDERHLCPLQLPVIERLVKLYSNPGEIVLDPFSGIGSTGYRALQLGRRYAGIELKQSYWVQAIRNLRKAEQQPARSRDLFALAEETA